MEKEQSRAKAIKQYCLECCCFSKKEVRLCPSIKCPLYPYRLGAPKSAKKLAFFDLNSESDKSTHGKEMS